MSTFSQLNYKHGAAKLQSSSSNTLSLTGNDGGNILVQSATTGNFMPVALGPAGLNQNLFNGTADVMFTANQSLQAQTLYSVYLRNLNGAESGCVMSFWPTFQGYNPMIIPNGDGMGMYVATTGGLDIGLMYLGQVFTGASDISTVINPAAAMRQPCYSHFNPWKFGFQTTPVVMSGFTTAQNGVQASPTILTVTEGISECPEFSASVNFKSNTANTEFTFSIQVSGTGIDGSGGSQPWSVSSPVKKVTASQAGAWYSVEAEWQSAPPIGVYTGALVVTVDRGSCDLEMSLLGRLSL